MTETPDFRFFAPCPRGLEPLLTSELESLGAREIVPTQGGVAFTGDLALCYSANLESRIASRVLLRIFHGPYRSEHDIYQSAYRLPWRDWFSARHTIKIKVSAQHCPLKSLDFVTLRIKDAVCDKFVAVGRTRPSIDTHRPDIRIDAFLDAEHVSLYIDTSGEPLFKRGLRKSSADAPLRENLAAGILKLSGWTPGQVLLDPMCGSGTILLEAAQISRNIAPGSGRQFAFEKLLNFDAKMWDALCTQRRSRQSPHAPLAIYGCDRDEIAVKAARANLEASGLGNAVELKQADVLETKAPADEGVLIANPPYGVRIGEESELALFYPRLGDALKKNFASWRAYFLTADMRLPKLIRLSVSRRAPLFNGPLECRLFEFKIVEGANRRNKSNTQE